MEDEDKEIYSRHLSDQIDAAQEEQEKVFLERAHLMGVTNPISVPDEAFKNSYFSGVLPWLVDYKLRGKVRGCEHSESPQPLWVFFENPYYVLCPPCADAVHTYKSVELEIPKSVCDICNDSTKVAWSFASYEYFTITGLICNTCHDKHRDSIKSFLD